jgi:hypothetical protein
MIFSNIVFFLVLAGFAYLVNFKFRFPAPLPKLLCNIFCGVVFFMWLLQLFGVGL